MRIGRRWLCAALSWGVCGLVLATSAAGRQKAAPQPFGERIDVRTGFVRVTLPAGAPAPRAEELEVLWKRQAQRVLRVIGGSADPIEVGIAVDRSASMHAAFEPMRAAALALVDQGISKADRVFVVGFANEARLLAEGRGAARQVLAALPASPDPGTRPTALWQSLSRALELFGNTDARAALIVVSDGCDNAEGLMGPASVARRASDRAIPIFLLMPGPEECRNTVCTLEPAGEWLCSPVNPPRRERHLTWVSETAAVRTRQHTGNMTDARSTTERDQFIGLIARSGGGAFAVQAPAEWPRAWNRIFEQLERQWTVVFEPTSDEVKSREIRVYRRTDGRRHRLN